MKIIKSAPSPRKQLLRAKKVVVSFSNGVGPGRYPANMTSTDGDYTRRQRGQPATVDLVAGAHLKSGACRFVRKTYRLTPGGIKRFKAAVEKIIGRSLTLEERRNFDVGDILRFKPVWLEIRRDGRISFYRRFSDASEPTA